MPLPEPDPHSDRCQECVMGTPFYFPCRKPAIAIIGWKGRTDQALPMCEACTDHNVRNRGGEIRSTLQPAPLRPNEGFPIIRRSRS